MTVHLVECPCGGTYAYRGTPDPHLYLQWYGVHRTHQAAP